MPQRGSTPPATSRISDAEVELWLVRLDVDAESSERGRALLSADEHERAARFHFPRDAARFVAGRGALRIILGTCLAVAPTELRLVYGAHGKPELGAPFDRDGLRFNLSHSEGLAICACTRGRRIGVDIERVRPLADWEAIAQRMFTPQEAHDLRRLPDAARPEAFFTCWTRHEARLKALGEGIGGAGDLAAADGWTLRTLRPEPDYLATVAVEGPIARLVCRTWPPEHP